MGANSFRISFDLPDNIIQSYPLFAGHQQQNLNPPVIGHTLQMPLHLLCGF